MLPARLLALLLAASTLAPLAAADHPGSVLGLRGLLDALGPEQGLVHHLPTVDAKMTEWETRWPDLVERRTIGATSTGHPLYNVRVTDEAVPFDGAPLSTGQKLRVYLDGGHHGNEFLGVELVLYYLEDLLAKAAGGDAEAQRFLRETEVYATPIINVDGNFGDTRKNARQVDPNRNYDFHWGEDAGSSGLVADPTYRGPAPFSEAETRANADFQTEIRPDAVVTMHTGIAEFYWPWGWTHDPSPDDALFTSLEKPFEDATNGRVDAMQGAELYIVTGASDDWAYATLGAPGFTFEVHEDQFIPIYGQPIPEIIADQLRGLDFVVRNVSRLGAWVEPAWTAEGLRLTNEGWGAAANVTVSAGAWSALVPRLERGESVLLPDAPRGEAEVSYKVLFIESAKTRTHRAAPDDLAPASAGENAVPAAGLPLAALGAVAAALAARRARR